ncbi:hypothetical protein ACFPT7_07245 [Acidicapsa dinghuensis]|uniref:Uncharacterized protein n=1 Tax=Acidicapsa dinghuensis TaxID=2218256 RepID=A0ABW1EDA3_9BACT|nr:hypothetical protein [Acidicapsa dinghuensis]
MWITEWQAISARITGLVGAGTFFLQTRENDDYSVSEDLIQNATRTAKDVVVFRDRYAKVFRPQAFQCIENFVRAYDGRFYILPTQKVSPKPNGFSGVTVAITTLESFRIEFDHLIADVDELTRSLAVRSFLHLQRSIVADDAVRERWTAAYKAGETACEKLGACQLLLHGIWAFKAVGTGEQTDLVVNEPMIVNDDIRRSSHGLVLTEWKIVRSQEQLRSQCEAAFKQARSYTGGILAGFPVASTRYLVMVSEDVLHMQESIVDGEIIYEYRNVAVNPKTPSKRK